MKLYLDSLVDDTKLVFIDKIECKKQKFSLPLALFGISVLSGTRCEGIQVDLSMT